MRPRYKPLTKVGFEAEAPALRTDHACPNSVINANPTTTVSDGNTPTLPAARDHQFISTSHEQTLPICETIGRLPAALSTNKPALAIASNSASDHNAAGASGPVDKNSSKPRLASSTAPLPHAGC